MPLEAPACIHRLFEAQAERTPDAPAIAFEGRTLTYATLNEWANRLARRLRGLGGGPDALVGVCAHLSPEMVIALLAVLKAGGAYLPLDPDYPAERLAFMWRDADVCALLISEDLRGRLPDPSVPVLDLDDTDSGEATDNLPGGAGPEHLAYVIYTSGSTGTPKGVEIAHHSVCNNLRWRQATFPLTAEDALLQTYSFSFDPSVWAFFWPLAAGARVVLPPPGSQGDPDAIIAAVKAHGISVLGFSPSLLAPLLDHPDITRCRSLRHVFCGGEALPADLVRRFHERLPAALHNVYGPTEATIDATCWTCRGDEADPVPIGHPLPGVGTFVLSDDGQPVPPGEVGELHIGGVGLARGYRHRPELTAERFIPNAHAASGFATLYRTGDLARQRPDGALEYLGRRDQQVKVRGFRIELGEVEAVLARHPGVRQAVVLAREDRPGDRRLVAYVVPGPECPSRSELRRHMQAALPTHMTPSAFVFLEALPLSPNGKIERSALPAPVMADQARDGVWVPPRTDLECGLVEIFETLLGVGPLGIADDFFDWGGHSLLAARLVEDVARLTGRRLPLSALADGATVARIASLLADASAPANPPTAVSPLLRQLTDGPGRPLFFWHGSFIGGLYCTPLARALSLDGPFYAFAPHGTDGTQIPPTVEAMAAECVTLLRRVQPNGPYRLGGYCNGGLVAYEAARQLQAQGQEVEFLALIEIIMRPTCVKLALHAAACRLGLSAVGRSRLSIALQKAAGPVLLALRRFRDAKVGRFGGDRREWAANIPQAYMDTAIWYNLRPCDAPVTLFAAADSVRLHHGVPDIGWRDLVPEVMLDIIPGTHFESINDRLAELANPLRARLEAARRDESIAKESSPSSVYLSPE